MGSGLLAASGVLEPAANRGALVLVASADVAVAIATLVLPWRRSPVGSVVAVSLAGMVVIGIASWAGVLPARAYGVFFVLTFAWLGLHLPARLRAALLVAAAVAYTVPIVVDSDGGGPFDPQALILVLGVSGLTSAFVAKAVAETERARSRAERSTEVFRILMRTTVSLRHADDTAVLGAVVEGVMALGYDGANLAVIDQAADRFHIAEPRGVAVEFADRDYSASVGLTAQVRASGKLVVIDDYQAFGESVPEVRSVGVRTCVAVPVWSQGELAGVLNASRTVVARPEPVELEVLGLLADAAGDALTAAAELEAHKSSAQAHAEASLIDDLTGIGNRRFGSQTLSALRAGDAVAILDLDHFKRVNDRFGHAAGDELLVRFAAHLRNELRSRDSVFRFGGEEFVICLPGTTLDDAALVLERIQITWRELGPLTTFSAGLTVHGDGRTSGQTMDEADAALYRAKSSGRDRITPSTDVA